MQKSLIKGPYICYKLLKKIIILNNSNKKERIRSWSRSSTIIPEMLGHILSIYNGEYHTPIFISNLLIGHKLGEFSETRFFKMHKKIENKIKKKNVNKK
jgi:small subunit ribosomal protein S19